MEEVSKAPQNPELEPPKVICTGPGWVFLGLVLSIAIDIAIGIMLASSRGSEVSVLFIGALQWMWLIPLCVIATSKGHRGLKNGMLIGGSLVLLLNLTFWGICFASLKNL